MFFPGVPSDALCVHACVCVCGCNPPFPSSIPFPTSSPSPSLVQNWKGWFSLESQISVENTWLWLSSRRGSQKGNRLNDKLRGWAVWTDVGWMGLWLLVRAGSGRQCSFFGEALALLQASSIEIDKAWLLWDEGIRAHVSLVVGSDLVPNGNWTSLCLLSPCNSFPSPQREG